MQACFGDDLDVRACEIYQEKFNFIERLTSWSTLEILPPGLDFYGAVSDGYVIGLAHNGSQIIALKLAEPNNNHSTNLDNKIEKLKIV